MGLAIRLGWIYGAPMDDAKNTQAMPISGDDAGLITMDLTGLKCPLPVLKARRQIGQMPAGGICVMDGQQRALAAPLLLQRQPVDDRRPARDHLDAQARA